MKGHTLAISPEKVRGFNYQPSYSSCSFEMWRDFRPEVIRRELRRGKELFPKINTVRLWLSWNAWCRNPQKFLADFGTALDFSRECGLKVIPAIFNRWHDSMVDCDGIYIDHFLPGASWLTLFGAPWREYVEQLASAFGESPDILVWDLCNEPFSYNGLTPLPEAIQKSEVDWLRDVAHTIRRFNVEQPIGISTICEEHDPLIADLVDLYLTHLYYIPHRMTLASYTDRILRLAVRSDKPTITTETCWGSLEDAGRVDIIRDTLSLLAGNRIGFLAHALWTSDTADLHGKNAGRVTPEIGDLSFIRADGSIRPGHDIFNSYC